MITLDEEVKGLNNAPGCEHTLINHSGGFLIQMEHVSSQAQEDHYSLVHYLRTYTLPRLNRPMVLVPIIFPLIV